MPFKSKSQARYIFMKNPKIAKEFAHATKNMASLPEHAKKKMAVPNTKKIKHIVKK